MPEIMVKIDVPKIDRDMTCLYCRFSLASIGTLDCLLFRRVIHTQPCPECLEARKEKR